MHLQGGGGVKVKLGEWATVIVLIALTGAVATAIGAYYDNEERRCTAIGGTVEKRFEYFTPVIIGMQTFMQGNYSYHCWINGEEEWKW